MDCIATAMQLNPIDTADYIVIILLLWTVACCGDGNVIAHCIVIGDALSLLIAKATADNLATVNCIVIILLLWYMATATALEIVFILDVGIQRCLRRMLVPIFNKAHSLF